MGLDSQAAAEDKARYAEAQEGQLAAHDWPVPLVRAWPLVLARGPVCVPKTVCLAICTEESVRYQLVILGESRFVVIDEDHNICYRSNVLEDVEQWLDWKDNQS